MARRTPLTAVAPPGPAGVARLVAAAVLRDPRARAATTAPTSPLRGADSYPGATSTAGSAAVGGSGWVQSRVWGVEP